MAYKKKMKFKAQSRTQTDVAIENRLLGCSKKEAEHIIYVGQLVERILNSEFGAVLKALTAGRASAELAANKDGKLSSDRILGRIEMADSLWSDLEQFVLDKDAQLKPLEQPDLSSTTEPLPMTRREETFVYTA